MTTSGTTQVSGSIPFDTSTNAYPLVDSTIQSALESSAVLINATVQATTNSILILTNISPYNTVFTGTVTGQIVQLPDTTTLKGAGFRYEIWNISTQNIILKNAGGITLTTLLSGTRTIVFLQDKSTSNGVWLFSISKTAATNTANLIFSQSSLSTGAYLNIGNISSSSVGYLLPTATNIVGIAVSCQSNFTSNTTIQLQNRSAVSTLTDIVGASLTVAAGTYMSSTSFAIPLNANSEVCAYIKSGNTPGFSVVTIFCSP